MLIHYFYNLLSGGGWHKLGSWTKCWNLINMGCVNFGKFIFNKAREKNYLFPECDLWYFLVGWLQERKVKEKHEIQSLYLIQMCNHCVEGGLM